MTLSKITSDLTANKFSDKHFPMQVNGRDDCIQKCVLIVTWTHTGAICLLNFFWKYLMLVLIFRLSAFKEIWDPLPAVAINASNVEDCLSSSTWDLASLISITIWFLRPSLSSAKVAIPGRIWKTYWINKRYSDICDIQVYEGFENVPQWRVTCTSQKFNCTVRYSFWLCHLYCVEISCCRIYII